LVSLHYNKNALNTRRFIMFNKDRGVFIALFLAVTLLLATGCNLQSVEVGPVQTKTEQVENGGADSVDAEITIGAGRLKIDGGAEDLLDATFTYNVGEWEPEIEYTVTNGTGYLKVKQPETDDKIPLAIGDVEYRWDLLLNDNTPLDLRVVMGAGEGDLELGSLQLNNLEFQGGAGDASIDLSGSNLPTLDVRLGAGNVSLDLTGNWQQDLSGTIKGGVGSTTLLLPNSVGVRVEMRGGLGSVKATDFNQNGEVYTNGAYGQSETTLDLEIETGIGEVTLQAE
jgi:hypothetical protein